MNKALTQLRPESSAPKLPKPIGFPPYWGGRDCRHARETEPAIKTIYNQARDLSQRGHKELQSLVARSQDLMLFNTEMLLKATHPELFTSSGQLLRKDLEQKSAPLAKFIEIHTKNPYLKV